MIKYTVDNYAVRIELDEKDIIHVLEPNSIVMFQSHSMNRNDEFLDVRYAIKKKSILKSVLSGKASILLALPSGLYIKVISLTQENDVLYELNNILFYTEGISLNQERLPFKHSVAMMDIAKVKCCGKGLMGLMSNGILHSISLHKDVPVFVNINNLISVPLSATIDVCTYGNTLASQKMDFCYKITGKGQILVQTGSHNSFQQIQTKSDNVLTRYLKEQIPGGSWIFK